MDWLEQILHPQACYNLYYIITLTGWLEPLLQRILEDERHVVCPVIDNIDHSTLQYNWTESEHIAVGAFDWNLGFTWMYMPKREKQRLKTPNSPARCSAIH